MTLIIGLLIPLLGSMLGSALVFLMKDEMPIHLQKALLGFALGVMMAASVWSLQIPAMEMEVDGGKWSVFPAAVGFLLGMGFLLLIDKLTPHLHIGTDKPEGMRSHLSKTAMLALAVTIHNLPEGMAVGVVFAGADSGATNISLASALAVCRYRHSKRARRSHYFHANAGGRKQPLAFVSDWFSEWGSGTCWSYCCPTARLASNARPPLYACFCRRCHVLRRGRGIDPRSL